MHTNVTVLKKDVHDLDTGLMKVTNASIKSAIIRLPSFNSASASKFRFLRYNKVSVYLL